MTRQQIKAELENRLDMSNIPAHIGIIMDGNGRWAKRRGLSRIKGHQEGAKRVKTVVRYADDLGVKHISLYAFSVENWARPSFEVSALMKLIKAYIVRERQELHAEGVKFKLVGRLNELAPEIVKEADISTELMKNNSGLSLNLCINYGSRYEMLEGAKKLALDIKEGRVDPDTLVEEDFSDYLYTAGLPDPDLMIRTSGELRISNFLLWQNAYAEFWFTGLYWPDFDKKALLTAIIDYQQRDRRFGGTTETQK